MYVYNNSATNAKKINNVAQTFQLDIKVAIAEIPIRKVDCNLIYFYVHSEKLNNHN